MFDKMYLIKSISAVTNYNSSSCLNRLKLIFRKSFFRWIVIERSSKSAFYCLFRKVYLSKAWISSSTWSLFTSSFARSSGFKGSLVSVFLSSTPVWTPERNSWCCFSELMTSSSGREIFSTVSVGFSSDLSKNINCYQRS